MFIEVIERKGRKGMTVNPPSFYLEQNNWNDYNYYTTYALFVSEKHTKDGQSSLIGRVKILKKGQQKHEQYIIEKGSLEELSEDYCSMADSLDYYERLAQLDKPLRDRLLKALRDIIIFPEFGEDFKEEDGFNRSLMRDLSERDEIFEMAPLLLEREFDKLLDLDLDFYFSIPELDKPIRFNFSSPKSNFSKSSYLPNRIAVLIGRNGSGKSTLLSRIARIVYSSRWERDEGILKKIGEIEPPGLLVTRVVLISYSAFDSFQTPGILKEDKVAIVEDNQKGLGRFVFCGIRDIVKELKPMLSTMVTDELGKLPEEDILRDRININCLKSIEELANEFCRNLNIIKELNRYPIFNEVCNILSKEPSLRGFKDRDFLINATDDSNKEYFMRLSTGHKFVVHALTGIMAYAAPRSLLLFDEPETHLHPPILAATMRAIRYVLTETNAFMILATHSSVILQETLRQHVFVVKREGNLVDVVQPEIQTFGENTGVLTSMAFGLSSETTDFHQTLDEIIRDSDFFNSSPEERLNTIEELFDGGLSMQARAYILSKIYSAK